MSIKNIKIRDKSRTNPLFFIQDVAKGLEVMGFQCNTLLNDGLGNFAAKCKMSTNGLQSLNIEAIRKDKNTRTVKIDKFFDHTSGKFGDIEGVKFDCDNMQKNPCRFVAHKPKTSWEDFDKDGKTIYHEYGSNGKKNFKVEVSMDIELHEDDPEDKKPRDIDFVIK